MNTVAHVLVACAAFSRPAAPKRNLAIVAGALVPDVSMFVFFGWSRLQSWSGDETWNVQYWTEPWQALGAISNSFVLFTILLAFAVWRKWSLLSVAAAAALAHLALDFPLHADDAHRHFWPLSDWRFSSPISYWDPSANGRIGAGIETAAVLIATIALWRRFEGLKTRGALAILLGLQVVFYGVFMGWAG